MIDFRVVKIFVSPRDELLDERKTVERTIYNMGLQPILGDVKSQPPSAHNREWVDLVRASDITILIIADQDSPYVREEVETCISEGKSVLVLRKNSKTDIDESLQKFLEDMHQYAFISEFITCTEIADKVREGIIIELSRKYKEKGEVIVGSVRMFEKAFELIRSAKKQLFLIVRTPPYLIPPESHDLLDMTLKKVVEAWVQNKIEKWSFAGISRPVVIPEGRFFYVLPALKEKIGENKNLLDTVIENLEKYKEIELNSEGRFKITSIAKWISPLAVADEKVCYYSPIYGREGFGIYARDSNIAHGITRFVEAHYVVLMFWRYVLLECFSLFRGFFRGVRGVFSGLL